MALYLILFIGFYLMWSSMILIALSLFRMKLLQYLLPIAFSALVLSTVSVTIHYFHIKYLLTILQPVVLIFCFLAIIRFRTLYGVFLSAIVYYIGMVGEIFFNMLLSIFGRKAFIADLYSTPYVMLFAIVIFNYLVFIIINKCRIGFSFIASNDSEPINKSFRKKIIIALIFAYIIMSCTSYSFYWNRDLFFILISIIFIIFFVILELSYRKEIADMESSDLLIEELHR